MLTIKTAELTGAALDWAVATALSLDVYLDDGVVCLKGQPFDDNAHYFLPTQNWAQGGPIIEREKIRIRPDNGWAAAMYWPDGRSQWHEGETPLIAAMRCYVASKLGDTVEIPEELL